MRICRIVILLIIIRFSIGELYAQNKQGNIVQYFGQEKVESIKEGKVIHLFNEGLVLAAETFPIESSPISPNPVFVKSLLDNKFVISEGKVEYTNQLGKDVEWESISVGEKNEFQDRKLRGNGYLYLEYQSESEEALLFEGSGHTDIVINGYPHEGDHYDYGWSLIPIKINKGINKFILRGGRFPRIRARLLRPNDLVQLTTRDMTLPDIIIEENEAVIGGIRVINASPKWFNNGKIICKIGNLEISSKLPSVSPMNIRKVPFTFPKVKNDIIDEKVKAIVYLKNENNKVLSVDTLEVNVKSKYKHHKRTFISQIDGSVQYYSVAPSLTPDTDNQALFLSVHGASVEAVNQANAYKQKDWGHLVAPTNRRPYGYAWENWGRLDALEVLNHAENLFKTNPSRTYLTGHSMGGHGTWQLGVNYPDRFAAIAPCAGYPDLIGYRRSFLDRIENMSDEDFERWGTTKSKVLSVIESSKLKNESDIMIDSLIRRSGNPSRTLKLKRNYLHHGVFILHGEKDNVVPTRLAREMREVLGQFHNDFSYYEYPDGTHWYGDHSVDWPPLFQFFKDRELKKSSEIKNIEFYTGSPGVSSGSHFVNILQQKIPLEISSFSYKREDKTLTTDNVSSMSIDVNKMSGRSDTLLIDGQQFILPISEKIFLKQNSGNWEISDAPPLKEKGPHRNGGFKDAFNNNVVLVYASKGTEKENEWYYNRAKYDAEKFGYLGNGSIEIIEDTDFSLSAFLNRNVVLYGNKDNNTAWNKLLNNCPVQVSKNILAVGDDQLTGENLGTYFIYPRFDSDNASVGVVSATGEKGMIAAFANDYLGRDAYPDIIVFDDTMMIKGISGIKCTGFFGNDWSISNGDLIWK